MEVSFGKTDSVLSKFKRNKKQKNIIIDKLPPKK